MQAAVEGLFADADDAVSRLNIALEAIGSLSSGAEGLAALLAQKQPKNDTLSAVALLPVDPGVIEQIQPGIMAVRPIDAADTKSLVTRQLGDSRWLGQNHQAASSGKWATPRNLTGSGDVSWSLTAVDGTANVNATTTLATVNTNTGTFGGATTSAQISVNGKGLITGVSAVTITPAFSSVTGKPTTLAGYGITDAQGLNANLTAIAGLTTAADKMIYWTGAGAAALITVTATNRTALSNLSGINTGDQTIILTGDATGSGTGSFAVTLATVNGNVGSFGSATQVATFTVNAKGLTTAAGNVTVTPAVGSITGLGTGVATALAVNVGAAGAFITFNGAAGTPSSLTLTNATGLSLTTGVTGALPAGNGGTGQSSYAVGDILYASTTTALSKLADVATGNVLISGGVGAAPSWGKVGLTTHVSGTLPVANGGTGNDGTIQTSSPTPTSGTGAFTSVSSSIRYLQIGKLVWVRVIVTITTNGTAASWIDVTLPVTARTNGSNGRQTLAAVEHQVTGLQANAIILDGTATLRLRKYDNTYLGGDGYVITAEGVYEAA